MRTLSALLLVISPVVALSQLPPDFVLDPAGKSAFVKGNYAEAESYFREALRKAEEENAFPGRMSTALGNLAQALASQGLHQEAEQLFNRALREEKSGSVDPRVRTGISDAMVNLGEQSILRRDFARAEEAFRRALSIRRSVYGPDHIEAALVATRLATVLTAQKKNEEAHRLFAASLPVQERVLGSESPEFAFSLEEFGKLLRQMEDVAQAETIEARARNIRDTLAFTVSADRLGK